MAGPETQDPPGEVAWPGAPWPAGPWPDRAPQDGPWPASPPQDSPWPDGPSPDDPWAGTPWPDSHRAATPWPGGPPPGGIEPRGGSRAGRHGASGPGGPRGLAAELAAMLPRGRRGLLAVAGALAIVGAGILAGVILTHGSGGTGVPAGAPGGTATRAGSAAGFTMTVPAGWRTTPRGGGTDFVSPAGNVSILVTHTAAGGATAPGQVRRQLAQGLRQGRFPGYEPIGGRPFIFQGGSGVAWQFTWQPARAGRMEVLDIAFRISTPAGRQAYHVRESAPEAAWAANQPVFRSALSTFRPRS